MSLFESIQKEHVINSIKQLDETGLNGLPDSKYYDIEFEGKRYPPKPIMVNAEKFATGQTIKTTDFSGGIGTPAFNKLNELGFNIIKKGNDSYSLELHSFLLQAKTENLKTKGYISNYKGLKVKVSFGQGGVARIPWVSFLGNGQTTSEGIYPVYLYFKKEEKLILAYGISETKTPDISWNLVNEQTVKDYFAVQGIKPDRYGDSQVFKIYDVQKLPNDHVLDADLDELISKYKIALGRTEIVRTMEIEQIKFDYKSFIKTQAQAGLLYQEILNQRFIASILTKPFVILTGLSGSGKTKLAQSFVQWISQDASQYCMVPVGADWTNREPLLGFPNALNNKEYLKPDNGVLDLILRAETNSDLPFFLILDEMNLSHVERYFADFLSVMESRDVISLHSNQVESENGIPSKISLPPNLFIIGTVNIDETTYMFSPKVLDRANTIEFRIDEKELNEFLNDNKPIDMSLLKSKGASMAVDFLSYSKNRTTKIDMDLNKVLVEFFRELKKAGAEFGYRSANEIQVLIQQLGTLEKDLKVDQKMDIAIMQKLLPKLHGSRRKLESILSTLGKMCLSKGIKEEDFKKKYFSDTANDFENDPDVKYPLSLDKICRMHQSAIDHGFASYAEA